MVDFHHRQRVALADAQRFLEAGCVGQAVIRHHLLHVLQYEVDDRALREAEHVAQAGGDDALDRRVGDDLLHDFAEVVDDHQYGDVSIDQLMLELTRGVERVDVDHRQAGTQDAENRDRVLQAVGHHHRNAVALLELQLTQQVSGELGDQHIGFAVGKYLAEVRVGGTITELGYGRVEHGRDGTELVDVDFSRHASRVALQPGTFLIHLPLQEME
ncbi:hypothetical protein D3C81_1501340 [compost metagenome]